jgi:hypothetical protein
MDPILALAFGVVVPALVALAFVVVLRRPFARTARGGETDLPAPWAAGFGLAAAYGIGVGLLLGWPDLPPVDVTLVAPWAAGVAAFLGLIRDGRVRGAASGVLGLGLGVFMTGPIEDMALRVGLIAGVTASMVALERGLARLSERLDPRGAALSQIVLVSGAALAVLFSDTASLAQATGGLAAGLGALFTLGLLWPRAAVLTRAAPAVAAILVTNLWGTTLFANGHPAVLAALTLAPLLVSFIPPLAASRRAILRIAVPAALIGIPIAAAGAFAGLRYFATEDASASEHAIGPTDPTSPSAATPATPSGTPTTPGTSGYDPGYGY